jgi:hypothetical protein
MSHRRDDITGAVRAQIALQCLAAGERRDGTRQALAEQYGLSRQSVYLIEQQARAALPDVLQPKGHGPVAPGQTVTVTPAHVLRSVLALADSAVPERKMQTCLAQILGYRPSLGWLSQTLAGLAARAAQVNAQWQPDIHELLAGDEIYCQGQPNLLVVGSQSLYIYALTQQDSRDGETWACVLWDTPQTPQFSRDGGTGLQAGAQLAGRAEQLDWWHSERDLWRIDSSLERQAYAVLAQLVDRERQFDQAHTPKRLAQHWAAWLKLQAQAQAAMAAYDRYHGLARAVDEAFAMIDLASGRLADGALLRQRLQTLGQQIHDLGGRACHTLGTTLRDQAALLLAYLPRLAAALAPLQRQWGEAAICALCQIWQAEAHGRRRQGSVRERQQWQAAWQAGFVTAADLLGDDLFTAWEQVQAVLGLNWRGSNAAECVNSLLRPYFNARKATDQKTLELRRFLHNTHAFARGKRAGQSPAALVGIALPPDPLTLLGLPERRLM